MRAPRWRRTSSPTSRERYPATQDEKLGRAGHRAGARTCSHSSSRVLREDEIARLCGLVTRKASPVQCFVGGLAIVELRKSQPPVDAYFFVSLTMNWTPFF